jgi:hypothetical protein
LSQTAVQAHQHLGYTKVRCDMCSNRCVV